MINIEDETSNVNEKTLKKSYNYKNNIYYKTKTPVINVITTTVPLDKCLNELWISSTDLFNPMVISLSDDGAWKRLNIMLDKAKNQEEFSDIEGLELINLPRCCTKNHEKAIKLICRELFNLKIDTSFVKNELIYSMQCMIHKYAKTDEDIIRLEEMIGLRQVMKKRNSVLAAMERQGVLKGRKEGIEIGEKKGIDKGILKVLNQLVHDSGNDYSVEQLAEKYGYSVEEILNANNLGEN